VSHLVQACHQGFATGRAKDQKGGCIFTYNIGCMQQLGGQTWNWGAQILNVGAGHHWPPAGDGPDLVVVLAQENAKWFTASWRCWLCTTKMQTSVGTDFNIKFRHNVTSLNIMEIIPAGPWPFASW